MEILKLTAENLERASEILKAIAHPVRISIIECLEKEGRLTVSQIHTLLGIGQANVSHHLGIMRDKGILSAKREGKNIYYSLKDDSIKLLLNCIRNCCNG
ncbi:MAG TPA: metalloregulator ArsR/SmtB family transcription factor [Bacteroidales bacterium]|nr:metalloregulator ArsR/SmtB family transcription factor [Bacteroidales bacterium]HQG36964.1 metalloregulator ArsR/SmtB family transcription factor [Bacteroidales bacterium]HQG52200.1 metalloregulator ArsR/SmtB family transcription factor [Bacteroidales bacterium]HQJ19986.1 metalloregulator ArsR/SmtB family transcription factor [Bacteroidales bacterium]